MPRFCTKPQSKSVSEFEQVYARLGTQVWRDYQAAKYHFEMADKYELAADRPWFPMGADPSPPPGAYTTFEEAAEVLAKFGWP